MDDKCFCHLNGIAVKDATARNNIVLIEENIRKATSILDSMLSKMQMLERGILDLMNRTSRLENTNLSLLQRIDAIEKNGTGGSGGSGGSGGNTPEADVGTPIAFTTPNAMTIRTTNKGNTFNDYIADTNKNEYGIELKVDATGYVYEYDSKYSKILGYLDNNGTSVKGGDVIIAGHTYTYYSGVVEFTIDGSIFSVVKGTTWMEFVKEPNFNTFDNLAGVYALYNSNYKQIYGGSISIVKTDVIKEGDYTTDGHGVTTFWVDYDDISGNRVGAEPVVVGGKTYVKTPSELNVQMDTFSYWKDQYGNTFVAGEELIVNTDHKMRAYAHATDDVMVTIVYRDYDGDVLASFSENSGSVMDVKSYESVGGVLPAGKQFDYWIGSDGLEYTTNNRLIAGDISLSVVFKDAPAKSIVTFMADSNWKVEELVVDTGSTYTIPDLSVPDRENFFFNGWEYNGVKYKAYDTIVINGDTTFAGVWTAKREITYYHDGNIIGQFKHPNGTQVKIMTPAELGIDIVGFQYWLGYDGTIYDPFDNESIVLDVHDITLTAHCEVQRTITFADNDEIKTMTFNVGTTIGLGSANGYGLNHNGYEHVAWVDGDGNRYNVGATYTVSTDETFTAIYERETYTMRYYVNGQLSGTPQCEYGSYHTIYGEPDSVDYPRPADSPYFLGWSGYQPGDQVLVTGSMSFYAEFGANPKQ